MTEVISFEDFLGKIRAGDQEAARDLVVRYERIIRREVRMRMGDHRLSRLFDSVDISQSVLSSFFSRAGSGHFELATFDQLSRLLVAMARNKVAFQVRRQHAGRRDNRLNAPRSVEEMEVVDTSPGPSQQVADRDLLSVVHGRLDAEERRMADLRAQGWEWGEIANQLGGTPRARQVQLSRAFQRVVSRLQLDKADDERP